MRPRTLVASAVVLVGALAALLFLFPGRKEKPHATGGSATDAKGRSGRGAAADQDAKDADRFREIAGVAEPKHGAQDLAGDPREDVRVLTETKAHMQEHFRFPPWSRPATTDNRFLHEDEPNLSTGTGRATVSANTYFNGDVEISPRVIPAKGKAQVRVHLRKFVDEDPAQVDLAAVQLDARVQVYDRTPRDMLAPSPNAEAKDGFADVGTLQFKRDVEGWVAELDPARIKALAGPHEARVRVTAKIGDIAFTMDGAFAYEGAEQFRIVSLRQATVDSGSLKLSFQVEAASAGTLRIQGGLFAPGGEAIAAYDREQPVVAGLQRVDVIIFGKVLREAGADGPYVFQHVRGDVTLANKARMAWRDDRKFATGPLKVSEFSDADWSGPEKDAALAPYDLQLAHFKGLAGAGTGP